MTNTFNKSDLLKSKFVRSLPLTLLALPGIFVIFIFKYLPMYGLVLPFKNITNIADGFWGSDWCGIENFKFLFSGPDALMAIRNTVLYNIAFILCHIVVGVAFALMLFELSSKFVKVYQTIIFLPYFISWVVGAFVVKALFDVDYGVVNKMLQLFGLNPVSWYTNAQYWPFIIVVINTWKGMGYNIVLYYAALTGINPEYFEAAKLDGATKLQQIYYVSIPLIKKVIVVLFILNVGKMMTCDFGLFYTIPRDIGLLYPTTDIIDTYVYRGLRTGDDIGMTTAVGLFQSVVGFIMVVGTNLIVKKISPENSLF